MPHNRYYFDGVLEGTVSLEGDEFHHLARVLRSNEGDCVELVNGKGTLCIAEVVDLGKHAVKLAVQQIVEERPAPPPLILAQAIPRMNHLEWIIEKGTELGATEFWLFPGLLSEKNTLSETQQKRLNHLCVSSMKQCGRLDLPQILFKPKLLEWKPVEGTMLFGDTAADAPYLWDVPLVRPLPSPVVLFIGPEKGFDPKEVGFLSQILKAQGVRLHPNILRAETAPLVALSLIQGLVSCGA